MFFPVPALSSKSQYSSPYYDVCAPFPCGNITFVFPFSPSSSFGSGPYDCGLPRYQITCASSSLPDLLLSDRLFRVTNLYPSDSDRLVNVVDQQLIEDLSSNSCDSLGNLSISSPKMAPMTLVLGANVTLYKCLNTTVMSRQFLDEMKENYSCNDGYEVYVWRGVAGFGVDPPENPNGCIPVGLPVSQASLQKYGFLNKSDENEGKVLINVLREGFSLQWPFMSDCESCEAGGGRCGFDGGSETIICFYKGGPGQYQDSWDKKRKLIIGLSTGIPSIILLLVFLPLFFKYRRRASSIFKLSKSRDTASKEGLSSAEQFIRNYRSNLLTNYAYSDIQKMTKGLSEKLGEGGYGNVYKGKTSDGRVVAVKMLENGGVNQNFKNEVATIGRIHHVNVIRLLGFCWDGRKQALIYEFMPNGSLADLLLKDGIRSSIGLPKLLDIAIGVANGIEYLHNGCDSRILHLDIKPQNVLLDRDFSPKISDFGLAKIYSRNRSHVSMTGAWGTIGYIAPEIFLRNLGNPSHKSDVYSYGMLLLELVGARKNVAPQSDSSEAYFPGWVYDKLTKGNDQNHFTDILDASEQEETDVARKMMMAALWCIQISPTDRPSMIRVLEMLTGDVEAIKMPPRPYFFSPPRVHFEHEVTSFSSDTTTLPIASNSQES
ncbi:Protein kinase domain [Dillenia turbinata]|uniref:Protein kinase domain n=1 Tax=Dillenia turbinata TaxID=194707 RepID=A0AAN8VPK6_9MAGN